ncbi:MAG: SulP family inorganic anion transporter [Candidatus Neomarinimicrobiota bacterium]|nr:MAG: SulP family inorganic anion transporter [bacterium]
MKRILFFLKSSLEEIDPRSNFISLSTNVKGDILAGITVGIIALPLALAFGEISQLGPIAGIWGAIAGGLIGGLFGGCLVGVSGPTAPKAAQIAAFMSFFVIGELNNPDLVAAFSIIFLSGLILVGISLLKISRFIHYTPYPVIAGFMCGIGVIVILTQINAFVGLGAEANLHNVVLNIKYTFQNYNSDALIVSIPCLITLFTWSRITKKIVRLATIPSPLAALILGTSIAYIMNLNIPYIGDKMGSATDGRIFSFYIPDFSRLTEFFLPALALAALAVLDSLLSCKVADNLTSTRHSSDRETFGQGMANMVAGLFGGVTTATATMRTVANIKFGAKTPLASIVHGLTLLAILLGLGSFVAIIPTACLAAILFKVGIEIMDYRIIPVLKKLPISDLLVFMIVLLVTVFEDLMVAIAIGTIFALFSSRYELRSIFNFNSSDLVGGLNGTEFAPKNLDLNQLDKLPVKILRPQESLFFGTIEPMIEAYSATDEHEILIVDLSNVLMIDLTGAYALEDLIKNTMKKNTEVLITGMDPKIEKTLVGLNFVKNIGIDNFKSSKEFISPILQKRYGLFFDTES